MPATTTLSTTQLAVPAGKSDSQIKVASTSGLAAGVRLFVDRELMRVVSLGPSGSTVVNVQRGVDGTLASRHTAASTMYIGAADQFYSYDPEGQPGEAVLVSPWINVRTGGIWFATGDSDPLASTNRWWQKQTLTYGQGALGVRTVTPDVSSST